MTSLITFLQDMQKNSEISPDALCKIVCFISENNTNHTENNKGNDNGKGKGKGKGKGSGQNMLFSKECNYGNECNNIRCSYWHSTKQLYCSNKDCRNKKEKVSDDVCGKCYEQIDD